MRVQTRQRPEGFEVPCDAIPVHHTNPIANLIHALEHDVEVDGPCTPAISRIGQQIVDTAVRSAAEGRTLPLLEA